MISHFNQNLSDWSETLINQARDLAIERGRIMGLQPVHDPIPLYGMPYSGELEVTFDNLKPTGLGFMVMNSRSLPAHVIRIYFGDQGIHTGGTEGIRKSFAGLIQRTLSNIPANHTFREIRIPWWHISMHNHVEANLFINWDGQTMNESRAIALIQDAKKEWLALH